LNPLLEKWSKTIESTFGKVAANHSIHFCKSGAKPFNPLLENWSKTIIKFNLFTFLKIFYKII
jgi:hypothetical protein